VGMLLSSWDSVSIVAGCGCGGLYWNAGLDRDHLFVVTDLQLIDGLAGFCSRDRHSTGAVEIRCPWWNLLDVGPP